jgi:hypothetical protein
MDEKAAQRNRRDQLKGLGLYVEQSNRGDNQGEFRGDCAQPEKPAELQIATKLVPEVEVSLVPGDSFRRLANAIPC